MSDLGNSPTWRRASLYVPGWKTITRTIVRPGLKSANPIGSTKQSNSLEFLWKSDRHRKKVSVAMPFRVSIYTNTSPAVQSRNPIQNKLFYHQNYPTEQENTVLICNPGAKARIRTAGKRVSKIPGKNTSTTRSAPTAGSNAITNNANAKFCRDQIRNKIHPSPGNRVVKA